MIPHCEHCNKDLLTEHMLLSGLNAPAAIITDFRTVLHFCNKFCFWEWTMKMIPDEYNLYKTKLRVLREQINNLIHEPE